MKKLIITILKPIIYYFLLGVVATICLTIVDLIINIIIGLNTGNFNFEKRILSNIPYLGDLIVNIVIAIVYAKWYSKLKKNKTAVNKKCMTIKDICLLIALSISVIFIVDGLIDILFLIIKTYYPKIINNYQNRINFIYGGSFVLLALKLAIISPISEELVFRGVVLAKTSCLLPFYVANIIQSLLFALLHLNLIQVIYAFPIGILLGYITMMYKSIIPSIIIHILFNTYFLALLAGNAYFKYPKINLLWLNLIITIVGTILLII
ncbi:MAG TPA: CPBP family glutamic-type intramembrane protease, partial [Mobilitalea sp.]|nr:CPBP family glutamic-type intramembrane protease [Mobilitalea sp.]